MSSDTTAEWHQTACILCSVNCGIEVRLDGRRIERVRCCHIGLAQDRTATGVLDIHG